MNQRGSAPLFLLVAFTLSIATGIGVYLFLKDRRAHEAAAETSAPKRAEAPRVVPVEQPVPAPEPEPPPEVTPPPVAPGDPLAPSDELSIEQVQTTLEAAHSKFADCAVTGRLAITLKIRPSGRVEQAGVAGADGDEMRDCVIAAAKRIKFPKSATGLTTRYVLAGE